MLEPLFNRMLNLRADPASLSQYQHCLVSFITRHLSYEYFTVTRCIVKHVPGQKPVPEIKVYNSS